LFAAINVVKTRL
jgi:solute carrier family 25 (mitochondrial citrate transporter), member 1